MKKEYLVRIRTTLFVLMLIAAITESCSKSGNTPKTTPPPKSDSTVFYLKEVDTASATGVYSPLYIVGPDSCWYKSPYVFGGTFSSSITSGSGTFNFRNICSPIQSTIGGTWTYSNGTILAQGSSGFNVVMQGTVTWNADGSFTVPDGSKTKRTYKKL